MKLTNILLVAAVVVAPLMAHAETTLEKIKSSKTLTIAFDPTVPPWSYKDDSLQYAGYEYDVAKKFAEDNGLTLEVVETNGANRIPLLMTNKVDLVFAAMTITPERKKVIAFSLPYGGTETAVNGPKKLGYSKPEELSGKRIAVARGTLQDDQVTKIAPSDAQIVRFDDEATAQTAVLSGQLDLVAQAASRNQVINKRNPSLDVVPLVVMGTGEHGIGMRQNESELKAWVDAWIQKNMGDGTLEKVFEKNIGTRMPEQVREDAISGTNP